MKISILSLFFITIFFSICLSDYSCKTNLNFQTYLEGFDICEYNLQMDEVIFESYCTHVKKSGWYEWNGLTISKRLEQVSRLSHGQIRTLYRLGRFDWIVHNEIERHMSSELEDNDFATQIVNVYTHLGKTIFDLLSQPVLLSDAKVVLEINHGSLGSHLFSQEEQEQWFERTLSLYFAKAQNVDDRFELLQAIVPWSLPPFANPLLQELFKSDIPPNEKFRDLWKWFGLHMDDDLLRTIFTNYSHNGCGSSIFLYLIGSRYLMFYEDGYLPPLVRALNLEGLDLQTKIFTWNLVLHAEFLKFDSYEFSAWKDPEPHMQPYFHHVPEEYYNLVLNILKFRGNLSERLQLKLQLDKWLKERGLSWDHVDTLDQLTGSTLSQYEEVNEKTACTLVFEYDNIRVLYHHIHFIWIDEKGFELYSYTGHGDNGGKFLSPYHITWSKNVMYFADPIGTKSETFKLADSATIFSVNRFGENYLVLFSVETPEEETTKKRSHRHSKEQEADETIIVGISKLGLESFEFSQGLDVRKIWPEKRGLRASGIKFGVVGQNMYFYFFYELCIFNLVTGERTIHKADYHNIDIDRRFYCQKIAFEDKNGQKRRLVLASNYDILYDPETETMPKQRYFKRKEQIDN